MKWNLGVLAAIVVAGVVVNGWLDSHQAQREAVPQESEASRDFSPAPATRGLPAEAEDTVRAILAGGPFPYDRDGAVFQNRERRLPERPRGWYREYTVQTPGSSDRGARRIVTGGDPPSEFFYTDDHYRSFRRLETSER